MYCIRTMSPQSLDCWVARRKTPGPDDEKVPNEPVVPMLTPVQLPVEGGAVQVASRVWEGGIVMSQRLLPELSATVAPMKFRTRRLLVSVPAAWMLTRASTASLVTIRVTVALSAWEAAVEPPS